MRRRRTAARPRRSLGGLPSAPLREYRRGRHPRRQGLPSPHDADWHRRCGRAHPRCRRRRDARARRRRATAPTSRPARP
jgi:hypothetical protein